MALRRYLVTRVYTPQRVEATVAESPYMFGVYASWGTKWEVLQQHYEFPDRYLYLRQGGRGRNLTFGIGGEGTGAGFHQHEQSLAEVFHGAKRWFLVPPSATPPRWLNLDHTSLQWYRRVYPTLDAAAEGLLECVVRPGEILFVPRGWYHSTLNLGECVFGTVDLVEATFRPHQ